MAYTENFDQKRRFLESKGWIYQTENMKVFNPWSKTVYAVSEAFTIQQKLDTGHIKQIKCQKCDRYFYHQNSKAAEHGALENFTNFCDRCLHPAKSKKDVINFSIVVKKQQYQKLKAAAADREIPLNDLVNELLGPFFEQEAAS
jgi:hypothetical protein